MEYKYDWCKYRCSCKPSLQAICRYSVGNGVTGSSDPEDMSDCMNLDENDCQYQIKKQ